MKVLFVCLGNICRSPLAEAVFKHKITAHQLADRIEADSCGTGDYHLGHQPDPRTIKTAQRNGVAIWHEARQLMDQDLTEFDYILAMDQSNYDNILKMPSAGRHQHKVRLLREFDPLGMGDVPDPYWGNLDDFQEVFQIVDRSMDGFLKEVKRTLA
ncbi:MAG: low molecular weight phosphotyrosine protein phosphatase [Cyclobacteriaceae bacterium]|nr:low molecular weight phosphotyrosine protein phosphatase [Cyclobacteriaceae bacterium]